MKIIDLLNKIANGEEVPKKIRITDIDDRITTHYNFFYDEDEREYKDDDLFPLGARLILDRVLNYEVEIIEEDKKIEKLDVTLLEEGNNWLINPKTKCIKNIKLNSCFIDIINSNILEMQYKINELIDKVNGLENKQ